tara:strand:- start:386 stop:964 length:579 start_codon:yes stop_codon:yes gene_type:complete
MKVYNLYIYVDVENMLCNDIYNKYKEAAEKHNKKIDEYIYYTNSGEKNGLLEASYDAGFDLFCPHDLIISEYTHMYEVNHKIVTAMKLDNRYVSYYLYSRSSTPKKTSLRLANNVGIIDSGYRGHIIANFDNMKHYTADDNNLLNKKVSAGERLVQICPPNIEYPMKIYLVNDINELGKTERGANGFGSTGK